MDEVQQQGNENVIKFPQKELYSHLKQLSKRNFSNMNRERQKKIERVQIRELERE